MSAGQFITPGVCGQAAVKESGSGWIQLFDLSILNQSIACQNEVNCACKNGHVHNYSDAYVTDLLIPMLKQTVDAVDSAGLLDKVYA